MAEYEMAFIITDCEMKPIDDNIAIVKRSSLTPEMMNDFVPFNFAVIKGEEDDEGRIQQYIKGDANEISTGGVIAVEYRALGDADIFHPGLYRHADWRTAAASLGRCGSGT